MFLGKNKEIQDTELLAIINSLKIVKTILNDHDISLKIFNNLKELFIII